MYKISSNGKYIILIILIKIENLRNWILFDMCIINFNVFFLSGKKPIRIKSWSSKDGKFLVIPVTGGKLKVKFTGTYFYQIPFYEQR